jgi:Flp pilus assembly protein TadB
VEQEETMAACTTTYFEAGRGWGARVAERNAELLAQQPLRRRGARTPEFFFPKHFDNTRLVKAADPVRVRQMRQFSVAAALLFSLVMIYGLQHFYAIESGYRVES